jgi:hypothetical protein
MHRPALALIGLLAASGWAHAVSPNPEDLVPPAEVQVKCRALVRQLGSEDYAEREDAQAQLASLGRIARPALLAGVTTSESPEVRRRCAELLPSATTLDIKAKLETFLADTNAEYEHDLPAWKTFRSVVTREWSAFGYTIYSNQSREKAARQVFADLVAVPGNRKLLQWIDGSRVELTELVVARKQELYERRYPPRGVEVDSRNPTLEEMTALLFADSRVGSQYIPRRGSISYLLNSSGFVGAARGTDEKGQVYRAIAAAWLDSRNEPREMYQVMTLGLEFGLNDQTCGVCARLLVMPGVTPSYRGRAASSLVYYGSKKHIPLLEKGMTNAVVVVSVRPPLLPDNPDAPTYEVQVRDIALAVSILLAEQKLADYGFTDRNAGAGDDRSYSYSRYYFTDDATRKKAFAKWAEWRKARANE